MEKESNRNALNRLMKYQTALKKTETMDLGMLKDRLESLRSCEFIMNIPLRGDEDG